MTEQHPITPPPELVREWLGEFFGYTVTGKLSDSELHDSEMHLAIQAARWGADQELEACCEWHGRCYTARQLRAARRPKPTSLKNQALKVLSEVAIYKPMGGAGNDNRLSITDCDIIRRALEQLDD